MSRPDSDLDLGVLLTRDGASARMNRSQLIADMMSIWKRPDMDVVILNAWLIDAVQILTEYQGMFPG